MFVHFILEVSKQSRKRSSERLFGFFVLQVLSTRLMVLQIPTSELAVDEAT